MSNDTISLVSEIDFESIKRGTLLTVRPVGDEETEYDVEVMKVNTVLTDWGEADVYLVSPIDGNFDSFIVGTGEIVKIIEEEGEGE